MAKVIEVLDAIMGSGKSTKVLQSTKCASSLELRSEHSCGL